MRRVQPKAIRIIGLDLSLRATGWASYACSTSVTDTKQRVLERFKLTKPEFGTVAADKKLVGMPRLAQLRNRIRKIVGAADVVIMEDLAFAARDTGHERAMMAGLVRHRLYLDEIPYVLVAPTTLKKFVTGKGNTEKAQMLKAVYKNWDVDAKDDNEADAIGLLYIGLGLVGVRKPDNKPQEQVLKTVFDKLPPDFSKTLEGMCSLSK